MEKDKDIRTDNEIIAEFMGYKKVTVDYFGTPDETQWQIDNRKWLNDIGIEAVGDYGVDVKNDDYFDWVDCAYDTSWDWLMPVVEKITPIAKQVGQQAWFDISGPLVSADISLVYNRVVRVHQMVLHPEERLKINTENSRGFKPQKHENTSHFTTRRRYRIRMRCDNSQTKQR